MKQFFYYLSIFFLPLPFAFAQISHHPQEFLQSIRGNKQEGKKIVEHFCNSCHSASPVISLGAPVAEKEADWLPRFKQGITILFSHTEEGFNAMPARGGCFECSDEQLELAIVAMLPESLRKDALNTLKDHKKSN